MVSGWLTDDGDTAPLGADADEDQSVMNSLLRVVGGVRISQILALVGLAIALTGAVLVARPLLVWPTEGDQSSE